MKAFVKEIVCFFLASAYVGLSYSQTNLVTDGTGTLEVSEFRRPVFRNSLETPDSLPVRASANSPRHASVTALDDGDGEV